MDTAAVEAAQVALDEAKANLAAVTLTSPIPGTVAQIPWTAGGTASSSDAVVILGGGAVDVTVDVSSAAVRSLKVGQSATAKADSATEPVQGVVSAIGLLPTATSSTSGTSTSSTTTYPVTVHVPAGAGLVDGGGASVSIVTATVSDVVRVPNSALRTTTRGSSVTVVSSGQATVTQVVTGTKGALFTQITSGLKAGQTVALADLSEALPTSSTTSNSTNQFGGGANGGPPGGFTGGPPGGFGGQTRPAG